MIAGGCLLKNHEAVQWNSGKCWTFETLQELKAVLTVSPEIPDGDLDDFRRAGTMVRQIQLAALLTAADLPHWTPERTAFFGWNGSGCASANAAYWRDYTENGRELGRASLFVPTLPSIPVCEAAITLKIHGPAMYFRTAPDTDVLAEYLRDRFESEPQLDRILVAEVELESVCILAFEKKVCIPKGKSLQELFKQTKEISPC